METTSTAAGGAGADGRERPGGGLWLALVRGVTRGLAWLPRPLAAAAAVGWMALIWWLSSGPIHVRVRLPEQDFFWNLAHAPTFALLGVLLARALAARPLPAAWPQRSAARLSLAVAAVALWAGIDEVHQSFVPGRNSSPFDFATDVTGAACALWVAAYAVRADAREGGLRWRLLAAVALCALAAAVSTARDRLLVS